MSRPNSNDRLPCDRQASPGLPHSTSHTRRDPDQDHRYNQSVSAPVERRGTSSSLFVEERSISPQTPLDPPGSCFHNVSGVPHHAPCDHRLTQSTFTGGQPAGLCQPTCTLRAAHESTPPTGSDAYVDHSQHTSNLGLRETYYPPRPPAYFTPSVSSPAYRYQPSPGIGDIGRSEPVQDRRSNNHSCRWSAGNRPCPYSVPRNRLGIEGHLRAYHRVSDNDRLVVCLWEGCPRTRPLKRENLARHLMTHMNVKWECPECKKLFARSDAVQRHLRRVCPSRSCDAA
ncbi:hypothetical protein F5141DRAFT_1139603 [Pisolithus sp. B1]|nr:hypothetical protein F5141DRAFT_1139603 [Pisolithus sp. B1]